jgi:hypothetical protein
MSPSSCPARDRSFPHTVAWSAGGLLLALAGCASPVVDAQWRNVDLAPAYLRGATVVVSCETGETVFKRICEDRVMTELGARGAVPVLASDPGAGTPVPPVGAAVPTAGVSDMQYLPGARAAGAKAVFSVTVGASSTRVSQGVSVGIGGFGFGRGSAVGLGVSAPIGGGQVSNGYSAEARVTDVASSRLMWTARTSTPPSSDVDAQLGDLAKTAVDAAVGAGLFGTPMAR